MKKLLLVIFLLPVLTYAQQKEEVVTLAGKSADEMYITAKEWFATDSYPGNMTIEVDDPASQRIIGKGVKSVSYTLLKSPAFVDVYYALSVQFKDGRYKYLLDVNKIKYDDGFEMSYEDFKSLTTKEGLEAYCKKTGVKPQFRSKVGAATFNNVNLLIAENLDNIIADLATHLKSDKSEASNW